jgi:hypothetical protein
VYRSSRRNLFNRKTWPVAFSSPPSPAQAQHREHDTASAARSVAQYSSFFLLLPQLFRNSSAMPPPPTSTTFSAKSNLRSRSSLNHPALRACRNFPMCVQVSDFTMRSAQKSSAKLKGQAKKNIFRPFDMSIFRFPPLSGNIRLFFDARGD